MIKAINIRKGNLIKHEGQIYEVTKTDHITPGKGNALMQVGVRDVASGKGKTIRFRPAEMVENVFFDSKKHQYMYNEGDIYFFLPDVFSFSFRSSLYNSSTSSLLISSSVSESL